VIPRTQGRVVIPRTRCPLSSIVETALHLQLLIHNISHLFVSFRRGGVGWGWGFGAIIWSNEVLLNCMRRLVLEWFGLVIFVQ